jgi:hypothetical protein
MLTLFDIYILMNLQEQIHRIQEIIKNDKNLDNSEYDIIKFDSFWVSIPKNGSSVDGLFMYSGKFGGGGDLSGVDYIFHEVPENMKKNRIVIYSHFENNMREVISLIKQDRSLKNINLKIKSVCGYSGGGVMTSRQIGKGFFIGLIDPYIDEEGIKILKSSVPGSQPLNKIRLLYSFERWESYRTNKIELDYQKNNKDEHHPYNPYYNLQKAATILGDSAVFVENMSHDGACKSFFNNFSNLI